VRLRPGRSFAFLAGLLLVSIVAAVPADATGAATIEMSADTADELPYSYYYVPRLAEVDRMLGDLVRAGHIGAPLGAHQVWYERVAAYGCDTTLTAAAGAVSVDIDWGAVTLVGIDPYAEQPTVFIRVSAPAGSDGSQRTGAETVRFLANDRESRDRLAYAMTVLMDACPEPSTR
jgi:hypothetical protein